MDDQQLLTTYLETFRLPPGASMSTVIEAFGRVTAGRAEQDVQVDHVVMRSTKRWSLAAEVVRPRRDGSYPAIVFIHGGGWTSGTPAGFRTVSTELARRGFTVVVPDYRRAPRDRFPAGFDDCRYAIGWTADHAAEIGAASGDFVVAGDSAGANLAAAALISLGPERSVAAALLYYGIFEFHETLPRLGTIVGGPNRTEQLYLPEDEFEALREDPRISPIYQAQKLPPTYLSVGSSDPLLDQTTAMAARLASAGKPHEVTVIEAAPHGFLQLPFHPAFASAYDASERYARTQLERAAPPSRSEHHPAVTTRLERR